MPHDGISVAEVPRLRGFGCNPNFGKFGYKNLITFSRGEFVTPNFAHLNYLYSVKVALGTAGAFRGAAILSEANSGT